ncbi:MAG: hypothetical protein KAS96_08390, partial [Planctomycetes bacterium]|nr:hypothetical protein [Planctomycetota bacterium]
MMYKKILFLALVTFFLAGIASASDPNLVGWWRMEAADPGDARLVKDSSGFGNDGTMGSSDAWMAGGGIDFDGGSWGPSGIVFANSGADLIADLGLTDQVTVSFVATWADGEKTKTNYPYDGRDASGTADGRLLSMECTGSNHIRNFAGGYDVYSWNSFDDTNEGFLFGSVGKSWGDYIRITTSINLDTGNYKLYVDDQVYHSDPNIYSDPNNIDQFSFEDLSTFTIGRTLWAEMEGKMKDFRIYNRELTEQEIKDFFILASLPLPGNNSVIITLPSLSWQSGIYAVSHDVYLGTTFADVNDATTSSDEFMGNQIANTYDTGSLTEGTYFWRVDEVNDIDVWKGEVWSFEIIAPILWLKMDEPNSSNYRLIEDSSGNGMDGTMGSLDTWIEIPGLGGGIDFDRGYSGASGIVFDFNDINDVITPNLSDQVTVSCWVTWNEWQDRVNYLYDARDSKGIRLLSNECPGLNHIRNHCGTKDIWVWEAFNPLTPSFFRDGATWGDYQRLTTTVNLISGAFKMYIDNELYTSQTVSAGGSMVGITSFYVGRDGTAFGCMGGNMTDFRLYNTVLEPEHIAELVGDYPKQAKVVSPAHESIGHPLNVNLQWRAGKESV